MVETLLYKNIYFLILKKTFLPFFSDCELNKAKDTMKVCVLDQQQTLIWLCSPNFHGTLLQNQDNLFV